MNNIKYILDRHFCCGCGACYSVCKMNAIKIVEGESVNYPEVNINNCVNCGACLNICPGYSSYKRFNLDNYEIDIKNILKCKICFSNDYYIRQNSASGGFITTLLVYLLDKKYVDGVICIKQSNKDPLLNEVYIAKDKSEVLLSMGSRYSPVSTCTIFKDILEDKSKKYVFVGKPCDIEAVYNMCNIYTNLDSMIFMRISILCHHTPSREGLKQLLNSNKIDKDNVLKLKYRGDGWPGYFKVQYKNNKVYKIPYIESWSKYLSRYSNIKCNYCDDHFGNKADITVGDPWGEEYENEKNGLSAVLIRNNFALDIVDKLERDRYISSKEISLEDVKRYQVNLIKNRTDFNTLLLAYKFVYENQYYFFKTFKVLGLSPKNYLRFIKKTASIIRQKKEWKYK